MPIANGFVINSAVESGQTIQAQTESVTARAPSLDRSIVLVGLMGAGKTRVGKRLAEILSVPFVDADHAIEADTGKTITELFNHAGELAFRLGERRMIARLLQGPPTIIAAGGGAYIDPVTRATIRDRALSLWLRADLDTLVARTSRSHRRPLLEGVDRTAKLAELMANRYPIYAEADLVVDSFAGPVEQTVNAVIAALGNHLEWGR